MRIRDIIAEMVWEYECNPKEAKRVVNKYRKQKKYGELCKIVMYKRSTPDFS